MVPGAAVLAGVAALCAAILPAGSASATPTANYPGLNAILAKADALSEQINNLSNQYDGLQIQLEQAQAELTVAKENAVRDQQILGQDQSYIGSIAVESYMTAGLNPALQLLQSSSPQTMLDQASIMTQLQSENSATVGLIANAATAAQRAEEAAAQLQQQAKRLSAAMAAKVNEIQQRQNFFNSQAYNEAANIFEETGRYPDIAPQGHTLDARALQFAFEALGDPYAWGEAGPKSFDCSGLVVWAYAHVGIHLLHFTGDLWNEGEHVSLSELAPGDLVFFYPGIEHVGLYVGNGLMLDAPTFGQVVQVQPMPMQFYDGAVEILG